MTYARYSGLASTSSNTGVSSLNSETGDITLTAGAGIAITTPTSSTIQIASTSVGDVTIGAFGSTPNAFGLSLTGQALNMQPADATHPGGISVADWNTFNNKQAALSITNLTDAGTDGITITNGTGAVIGASPVTIAQHVADTTHNGYLSSTDWNTFNGKQAALTIGNLTDAGTDGITVTGGTGAVIGSGTSIAQHVADTTHNGYLSSTDWNTFNGKGAGSVTSVGLSVPATSIFGVTGTPVTGSGTLGLTTTGTSGGIPYFSSTSALSSSALLTASQLIVGGGAGVAPATLAAGSQFQVLVMGASNPGYGQLNLGQSAAVTGTLLAAQFPALTGDITTSAGALATTAAATQANIVTLSKSTGVAVHGTNTNDNASAGYVGEYIASVASATDFPANNTYGDLTNIVLTAGDWDLSLVIDISNQGGTYTQFLTGIGTASGNASTGLSNGDSAIHVFLPTGSQNSSGSISGYRVSISAGATYYFKYLSSYSGTAAKATGRLSARRMR